MKNILATLSILTLFFGSIPAAAQLQAGLNVRNTLTFNSPSPDNLIFKYQFGETPIIPRLRVGYAGNSFVNQHLFHKEEDYTNLDQWPSDVGKEGYNKSMGYTITPGVEMRYTFDQSYWYFGIDVQYQRNTWDQVFNWHGEFDNGGTPRYTISNVRENRSKGSTTTIMPMGFVGFGYNLGEHFTIFGEASVGPSFSTSDNSSEFVNYWWDNLALEFVKQENNQDPFEEPDQIWQKTANFNPTVNLFIAYKFGSMKQEAR